MTVRIGILPLDGHDSASQLPAYETPGSAGMDLRACLTPQQRDAGLILPVMGRTLVPTALAVALPDGYEAQIRPRSGLAARHGITVLNSPGTIDSDYRGEVKVLLINLGHENYVIRHGDRIAQMVIARHAYAELNVVTSFEPTARGAGGFGSTGST